MTIRNLTIDDFDNIKNIILKHNKIQNMPKKSIMSSVHDKDTSGVSLYDRTVPSMIQQDLSNSNSYWFGNFSSSGILLSFIKFYIWYDSNINDMCWTMKIPFKNKNIPYEYKYSQDIFPDEVIDVINHGVRFVEDKKMTIGYNIAHSAVSQTHPNHVIRMVDIIDPDLLLISKKRYMHELIETIPAGQFSTAEEYRINVSPLRFSIPFSIYRMTKL